jgi:hypothetical protein
MRRLDSILRTVLRIVVIITLIVICRAVWTWTEADRYAIYETDPFRPTMIDKRTGTVYFVNPADTPMAVSFEAHPQTGYVKAHWAYTNGTDGTATPLMRPSEGKPK